MPRTSTRPRNALLGAIPYQIETSLQRLGRNLRIARLRRNLTAEDVAEKIGASRFAVADAEHGKSYLERADAVAIDPVELKLATRVYETTALKGIFGALRDSGPDYWGRTIIERHVGRAPLSELGYLLLSSDNRAGALGFGHGQK